MDIETPEQIAQHYKAMGDSVWLIKAVIDGTQMVGLAEADKKGCVERNVAHLELMRTKDFWTDEDFTEVEAAIVTGKVYVG